MEILMPAHLNDNQIRQRHERGVLKLVPFDPDAVQPASYDVTLDPEIRWFPASTEEIDLAAVPEDHTQLATIREGGFVLQPGQLILGCTRETVGLPGDLCASVHGKSSLGRLGLAVHVTAGFIDPGFFGQITLEIVNLLHRPIRLHAGMRIGQLTFQQLVGVPQRLYGQAGNRYQGQRGPVESRYKLTRS